MSLSGKTLLKIDRVFWLPYKLIHWLVGFSASPVTKNGPVLIIKFMGLGSITRFAELCRQHKVDLTSIQIITFKTHADLCNIFGFQAIYIRSKNVFHLILDSLRLLFRVRSLAPSIIVDFERCSNLVGIFRLLLAQVGKCKAISFNTGIKISSAREDVISIDNLNLVQLFEFGIALMPKRDFLQQYQAVEIQSNKVLININSSDYLLARRYSPSHYVQVVESLHQWNDQLEFYFTGSLSERKYVSDVIDRLNMPAYNQAGKWDLKQLLNELSTCALFITGDSGPLHLATFLGIPVIAIWGPTQPTHFGYESRQNLHSITLDLPCSPCLEHPKSKPAQFCHGRVDCLSGLDAQMVYNKALEILGHQSTHRSVFVPDGIVMKDKTVQESAVEV